MRKKYNQKNKEELTETRTHNRTRQDENNEQNKGENTQHNQKTQNFTLIPNLKTLRRKEGHKLFASIHN